MLDTATRRLGRLRVLLPSLSIVTLVVFANYSALLAVLLPNQIEALDPANKVANLALVTTVSFVFTLFCQPLVGALSDRTRSRLGRRAPWMIAGSVVAGGFLVGMGGLGSVLWICVFWVIIQFALNAVDVTTSAFVPDRFPRSRRGIASAVIGAGAMAGGAVGTVVAGRFVDQLPFVYTLLGVGVVVVTILFVLANRERPSTDDTVAAFDWRAFIRGFWIDPRKHPDFGWAFASRVLFIAGYYLVYTFQLYILTDYIQVTKDEANQLIGILTVVGFVAIIISVAVGGWWSDRLARRKIFLIVASVLLAVALAVPLIIPTVTGMFVFAAIKGLGFGLYLSCGNALITEVLPNQGATAAKDLGIYNVATNLPQALAPMLAAFLIESAGGYSALFAIAIVGVVISGVLITRVRGVR